MKLMRITTNVTKPFEAKLLGNNPKTAKAFWSLLPVYANARLWHEELYFKIPIKVNGENQQKRLNSGDIAFWPSGKEVSIFFGQNKDIPIKEKLNVFGRIIGNSNLLKIGVTKSRPIIAHIEKLEE